MINNKLIENSLHNVIFDLIIQLIFKIKQVHTVQ